MNFTIEDEREFMPRDELRKTREGRMFLRGAGKSVDHMRASDLAPFVAWDGEGITEGVKPHAYILFGNSLGHEILSRNLTTDECLRLILHAESEAPDAIHVAFAFKYDVEMILRELSDRHWMRLRRSGNVNWNRYRITYHPGKRFTVSRGKDAHRLTATIYDLFGFFQSSFVKALRGWLDAEELGEIDRIEQGKSARGEFSWSEVDSLIRPYWQAELRLLVLLADRLRSRLIDADVCPTQWHGPGAVASVVYRKHNTRKNMARTASDKRLGERSDGRSGDEELAELPEAVNRAAQHAYAGGRFELFRMGYHNAPVYQYDINSAYPNAIASLPSLDAEWQWNSEPSFPLARFGVYEVEYDAPPKFGPFSAHPFFYRDEASCISYPMRVRGWYWTPEASIALRFPGARILGGWELQDDGTQPFAFVREMYATRQRWKKYGNPAERALKLALNSLYGKMAQRAGWHEGQPLPRFHQLEWAGYVTSYTRSMLYEAMMKAGPDLLAVETDAVFSLRPLDLDCGPNLGQWEATQYDWILYLSSGTYWTSDGKAKYRGLDSGSLSFDHAMDWLRAGKWFAPIVGHTSRFIGAGRGMSDSAWREFHWRNWITEYRSIRPGMEGKRKHVPNICRACRRGIRETELHDLVVSTRGGSSVPHSLPWIGKDSDFAELANVERFDSA